MAANEKQWSSATPGLLIFLIDQSGSMTLPYEGGETRSQFASKALNRMIDNTKVISINSRVHYIKQALIIDKKRH